MQETLTGELTVKVRVVKTEETASPSSEQMPGEVKLRRWSKPERLRRSLRALLVVWLLAFVSVFLPLLHFILVPIFFLGAPALAWLLYQQEGTILSGSSNCPNCKKPFLVIRAKEQWPLLDRCNFCQQIVRIEKV